MRHLVDRRKLGLPSDQRRALLHNLARQFVRHGYVRTTFGRAKELQRIVEKLITVGKQDTVAARRQARRILVGHSAANGLSSRASMGKTEYEQKELLIRGSLLTGEDLVKHLFDEVAPRFKDRNGGYTRLTKAGQRRGDGAVQAVLELVD
jgi:large subunit ribosomal protein L17